MVELLRTASANGFDQVKRSLISSGSVVLDILHKALLMLLLEMLPLMAVVP